MRTSIAITNLSRPAGGPWTPGAALTTVANTIPAIGDLSVAHPEHGVDGARHDKER